MWSYGGYSVVVELVMELSVVGSPSVEAEGVSHGRAVEKANPNNPNGRRGLEKCQSCRLRKKKVYFRNMFKLG